MNPESKQQNTYQSDRHQVDGRRMKMCPDNGKAMSTEEAHFTETRALMLMTGSVTRTQSGTWVLPAVGHNFLRRRKSVDLLSLLSKLTLLLYTRRGQRQGGDRLHRDSLPVVQHGQ